MQLRNLWRAAETREVRIPCGSKASAILVRFQLYNAVRSVRQDPSLDPSLMRVIESVQIRLEGADSEVVVIGKSEAAAALDAAFAEFGAAEVETGPAQEAVSPESEQEAAASLARMLSMVPRALKG